MADKKISALPAATTPLAGTEVLPIVQGGVTDQVSVANLTAGRAVSATGYTATNGGFTSNTGGVHRSNSAAESNSISNLFYAQNAAGNKAFNIQLSSTNVGSAWAYNGSAWIEGWTVTTSGDFKLPANNLVVGTANKGIDFSANTHAAGMTSELLNDYEEGTWTPTAVSTGGAITTYTSAATYTKIGRLVYINGYVQITNPGTASGGLVIDAIPYVNGNAGVSGKGQQMSLVRESENTGQAYLGFMLSNSTQLRISALTGAAVSWNANDQYSFSLCYYTS